MGVSLQTLAAKRGGDLFVPLVFRLALRLEQVNWDEALEDAPLAAFALASAQKMFATDACVNWFDTGLEAEATGVELVRDAQGEISGESVLPLELPDPAKFVATPTISHVLAVTRQLCETTGQHACVLGCLTGPATLLRRFFGAAAAEELLAALAAGKLAAVDRQRLDKLASLSVSLARAYCELGVGGLVLVEEAVPQTPELAAAFDALFNLAAYYGVPIVVVSRAAMSSAVAAAYTKLGAGYIVAPGTEDARVVAIAPEALLHPEVPRAKGAGHLVATTWEVPAEVAPERLADFGARLKH